MSCVAAFAAWTTWLGWRVANQSVGIVGIVELVLEAAAFGAAVSVTIALWPDRPHHTATAGDHGSFADRFDALVGIGASDGGGTRGIDDTGEVLRARQGVRVLDVRRRGHRSIPEVAAAVVAVEGIRRMAFVACLVAVLLTGRVPFGTPPVWAVASLLGAQMVVAVGHWLLSGGAIRPGDRLRWSMASVGAGFGDGISRSGLPIRWATTMATIVVLNIAVALRGFSDRWTHGLGALTHDERVVAMTMSCWLVGAGFLALRALPQPTLGFYGATRRLEESSTRRLALGGTLAVAIVGVAAGILPGVVPS